MQGTSSDEEDEEATKAASEPVYLVHELPKGQYPLSTHLKEAKALLDEIYINHHRPKMNPGMEPHTRVVPDTPVPSKRKMRTFLIGLPLNFYDADWYGRLDGIGAWDILATKAVDFSPLRTILESLKKAAPSADAMEI